VTSAYLLILRKQFLKHFFICHIFLLYFVAVVDLTGLKNIWESKAPNQLCPLGPEAATLQETYTLLSRSV
jgi:hypothetical protein